MNICRLCHSKNMQTAVTLSPMPIGDAYVQKECLSEQNVFGMDLHLCADCGLAQLPEVAGLDDIYRPYIYRTSDSSGLVEHFKRHVENICAKFKPPANSLAVDIGSNDGTTLKFFKEHGMKVLGFDPATVIAREAGEAGIFTRPDFFTAESAAKARLDHGQAFIITANNVFANVNNPDDFMAGIKELLAPDGIFVIETGYVLDLLQKTIFDNIYHEHLNYFSVKPLDKFFARHDMRIVDVERINTKGGSIRCFIRHAAASINRTSHVNTLLRLEEDCGVHDIIVFKQFAEKLDILKRQMFTMLARLKQRGKKTAGYGASVGVTTILYNYNLGAGLIDYLMDDNPNRQGLYSPGFHIPVFAPTAIHSKQPDYIVILAWQYAAKIIEKHRQYLENGGYFILPLPYVGIIDKNNFACKEGA